MENNKLIPTLGCMGLVAVVLLVLIAGSCGSYTNLNTKQKKVQQSWANVEVQIQRRSDLIPNLFEAAKAAGVQEQEVFGDVAAARSRLLNAQNAAPTGPGGDKSPEEKAAVIEANSSLGTSLGRLLMLTENYPQLKSNENFLKFQDELSGTENRIAVARKDYNDTATDYNTDASNPTGLIVARLFSFQQEPYFKADEGAKQVPKIKANTLRKDSK